MRGRLLLMPLSLLADLVAIDSVNPDLVPGAAGESALATFCAEWMTRHGLEVHRLEGRAGRPSIVGIAKGTGGGPSLLLNGHLDTVSIAGYDGNALEPVERDGKLFGRGSFDMKSGLAAMMVATARARESGLAGDVLVACVADEEFGSIGTEEVLRHFRADAAIVVEPSHLEVTMAHRGFAWFEVVLRGKAAHGSTPHSGIDAIAHAGRVMAALDQLGNRIRSRPPHPLLGHGAVRIALIRGGEDAATVAAECRMTIERRMMPAETPDAMEAELATLLEGLAASDPQFDYTLTRLVGRQGFEADQGSPVARAVVRNAERVLGRPPVIRGEPFWTDAGLIAEAGIPCVVFGVDGGGAHAATEWVTTESLHQVTDVLTGVIQELCGPRARPDGSRSVGDVAAHEEKALP